MFQKTHLSPDWFARQPRLKPAAFAILLAILFGTNTTQAMPRERLLLDKGWRFSLGSAADPQKDFGYGADWQFNPTASKMSDGGCMDYRARSQFAKAGETSPVCGGFDFDDSGWRQVDLPHDWAVELPFDEKSDFSHGFKPIGRGYPDNSIGWYRRTFELSKEDLGKRISVEFDGVFRDCTLWINGHFLGRHLSGYSSFHFDITDYLHYGTTNLLVVRVDATQTEGWFYEGAGIYRHVWLDKTAPLHVAAWGTYVTASVAGQRALVTARARIANEGEGEVVAEVVSDVLDPQGKPVGKQLRTKVRLQPHEEREISEQFQVKNPTLWSLEDPRLYRLVTTIRRADEVVDRYETTFGIRTIFFDPDHGFFLNGKHVFLKGACFHQNHAGVGTAIPDRLIEYRLQRLQEMGCNAIRSSHYPPTPELLEACDRLGMLVIDEHRLMGSCPEILDQLETMIRRDRNHPSIIIWSIGNEEFEIQGTDLGVRIATTMQSLVHRLDPTRPVTVAMDYEWGKGFSSVIDLQGFNYKKKTGKEMDEFHRQFPKKPTLSTEEGCAIGTRGIYTNDSVRGYVSAYDDNKLDFGSTPEEWWNFYLVRPWLAGAFIWTGFDYRGAPAPYRWPCINSHVGVMDTCGFPKDSFYYYQSWWTDKPVLHLLPHWNWPGKEGQEIDVRCFSNLEEVELLLNGQSLGRKPMPHNSHLAWLVKYSPGILEARGYKGGKLVATTTRETAGAPAAIALEPDRATLKANGEDVSVITVSVRDTQGRLVPTADNEITFTISGGGHNIGVGNGNPSSHEPDKAGQRRVFNGLAQLIVQATAQAGSIQVTAESPGLKSAVLRLSAQAAPLRPAVPASASSSRTTTTPKS